MADFKKPQNIVIIALALAVAVLAYFQFSGSSIVGNVSAKKATENALSFINTDLLQGTGQATLVGEPVEENGIYKFQIDLAGQKFFSYVTKNGKMLFPEGMEIKIATTTPNTSANTQGSATPKTCEEVQKTDKPILEAFVVSYCPYGLQMQRILAEVVKGAPELQSAIKIKYIGAIEGGKITAMHGDTEAQENLKQICIREEQADKFFPYLNCFMKQNKSAECSVSAKVDTQKLSACIADPNKGLKYAQQDFTSAGAYKVSGSPTLILNGQQISEFDFGGRTADALKTLTCCSHSQQPGICSTKLSQEQAAVGASETYAGTGAATNQAANCNPTQ